MSAGALPTAPLRAPSPWRALSLTAAAIFCAEAAIMSLFELLPPLPPALESLADAALLCAVTLPVVYMAWFRPLRREMELRARASASLAARALEDSLTALPNRYAFNELVQKELAHARRLQGAFTVVVLDVRRFSEVNGALGHESGDLLLKLIAERLRSSAPTLGSAARLGSDLFGVLLSGVDLARAPAAVARLHELLEVPFSVMDAPLEIEGHTGFAAYPQHGDTSQVLVQRAELALLRAKRNGDRSAGYGLENESQAKRRLDLVRLLRKGIEQGELSLVYQPKIALNAGEFAGAEALVRWNQPELGFVSPAEFVPLAEQTNLIRPLSHWVLEEAIRQVAAWRSGGLLVPVSVNLSARNLADETLPERVAELLARWDVPPELLTVEVTESAVLAESDRAATILERFRRIGVALSIDDFGTGYSSLTYLRTMPAAELKIDRSFVRELENNQSDAAIVRAVIGLAHSLGLKVVSEGVETEPALLRLRELGCDLAQGYFLSKPLAARELADFVAKSTLNAFAPRFQARETHAARVSLLPRLSRPPLGDSLRAIRAASSH